MENAELDVALEELENRLERLRALYEQYFMGIERIEPAIPRKDIDRRIYVLRREKIRNTAKRFKLQTIISRYNTFQQYWQRICREIEHGTYLRHVIRAERIAPGQILTIAARKRSGGALEDAPLDSSAPPSGGTPPSGNMSPSTQPGGAQPPTPDKPLAPPKPKTRPVKPPPNPEAAPRFEALDLDLDFMADWDPSLPSPQQPKVPRVPSPRPPAAAVARPLGAAPIPGHSLRAPAALAAAPRPSVPATPALATTANPAPWNGAAVSDSSGPATRPAKPPAQLSQVGSATPIQSSTPPVARPATPPVARPATPPVARPAAPPVARPASPPVAPGPVSDSVSEDRVRELHARLVEAKRQTRDAAAVSVEGLAKSLKATEAKLREQHKNKKIDFEVVIKDGRAVLKPILR